MVGFAGPPQSSSITFPCPDIFFALAVCSPSSLSREDVLSESLSSEESRLCEAEALPCHMCYALLSPLCWF